VTDQPKSTQLSPEEWKQLCCLNSKQLFDYITNIPAMVKADETAPITAGLTAQHVAEINAHIERGAQFLGAWLRSKPVQPVEQNLKGATARQIIQDDPQAMNGAQPTRQKRKYTKRAKPEQRVA
jgi:hypothetical protein